MSKQIDVWLLTGYLGSGKTTTLKALLNSAYFQDKHVALIINEFGQYGIDGLTLKPSGADVYEINKGSIFCCCVKTEFVRTIEYIRDVTRPDVVLIEATGVAETSDLEQFINETPLRNSFRIRANVCLVDALNFTRTAAILKTAVSQVRWADGLIINKTDLVGQDDLVILRELLFQMNPQAKVYESTYGQLEDGFLEGVGRLYVRMKGGHERVTELHALSFENTRVYSRCLFLKMIDRLKGRLLRLKGHVQFQDGMGYVEVVFNQVSVEYENELLPKQTYFSAIGWRMSKEELKKAFDCCFVVD